tara:strand:- start:3331 stop:5730 length:2400 start_codon:yes stop_codon:yes gene_type:complete
MSRQFIERADYVRFSLQVNNNSPHLMKEEPGGWKEDGLEIIRNKKYHGVFVQFSGDLKFTGYAKDLIIKALKDYGINVNIYLTKEVLRKESSYKSDGSDEVKYKEVYRGIADPLTIKYDLSSLTLNFNSDELESILKSHESDDFELDRQYSIDNAPIDDYTKASIKIKPRNIQGVGEHKDQDGLNGVQTGEFKHFNNPVNFINHRISIKTSFITKGLARHVEVNANEFSSADNSHHQDNMFYNDSLSSEDGGNDSLNVLTELKLVIKMSLSLDLTRRTEPNTLAYAYLQRYEYDSVNNDYVRVLIDGSNQGYGQLSDYPLSTENCYRNLINIDKEVLFPSGDVLPTTSFSVIIQIFNLETYNYGSSTRTVGFVLTIPNYNMKLYEDTIYNEETKHDSSFVNNVASRILEIITGKKNKFFSKLFGRNLSYLPSASSGIDYGIPYQDYSYENTGEQGHVALIHGMDIRAFNPETSQLYKELSTSFKNLTDDLISTFNIGVGIENSPYGQRVRFEKLEYFFQNKYVVNLENSIELKSRKVDNGMFFSACEFGSTKGGDYEHEVGLDEPNVKSAYVTPLRKTNKKYNKVSKIRSDEYGMELLKRYPASLNELEDRSGDAHIWYLDLKWDSPNNTYTQLDWEDSLAELPVGVHSPETYHNWKFTPKRCMLRHGWILRAGMEVYELMSNEFSLINSNSNINLETRLISESLPVKEKENVKVRDLGRSFILPEIITFTYPIDDDMLELLNGSTEILVEGSLEFVPNWYFQVKFINENGQIERGYIKSIKPNKNEWVLWKANDENLF